MKPAIWKRSTEKNKKSSFFLTLPPPLPTIRFRSFGRAAGQKPEFDHRHFRNNHENPTDHKLNETPVISRSTRIESRSRGRFLVAHEACLSPPHEGRRQRFRARRQGHRLLGFCLRLPLLGRAIATLTLVEPPGGAHDNPCSRPSPHPPQALPHPRSHDARKPVPD